MEKDIIIGLQKMYIKEIGYWIKDKVKEHITGIMEIYLKAIGLMIWDMAKE